MKWEEMQKIAEDIEEIWEEYYYSPKKFELIEKYIKENGFEGKVWLEPRAVRGEGLNPRFEWFGWKGIDNRRTDPQYRMRWHSGRVMAIIFKERPEDIGK